MQPNNCLTSILIYYFICRYLLNVSRKCEKHCYNCIGLRTYNVRTIVHTYLYIIVIYHIDTYEIHYALDIIEASKQYFLHRAISIFTDVTIC